MTHPQTEDSNIFSDHSLYLANTRLNAIIHALILKDLFSIFLISPLSLKMN